MTLQTKIISSFVLSAAIVASFVFTSFVNLSDIRREIQYIELTDSIRTKTLQLRRYEKNYFLYREQKEIDSFHQYLSEIDDLIAEGRAFDDRGSITKLDDETKRYSKLFEEIVVGIAATEKGIEAGNGSTGCGEMIKVAFVERPLLTAEFIGRSAPGMAALQPALRQLSVQINDLRKTGDNIITISREIDRRARDKVDHSITVARTAALTIFPAFLLVGFAGLFFISRNVVKRLNILTSAAESTGRGDFKPIAVARENDEVGVLMAAFDKMESDLRDRDEEIRRKNEELYQSRKLASIGTLASGVAHELNNPLNNIYLSAQVLINEIPEGSPPMVQETVEEIYSETLRVKRIVNDLLEFSRSKKPEPADVDIAGLVRGIVSQKLDSPKAAEVEFHDGMPERAFVMADRHMLEQVVINLVDNAIDAMRGKGRLSAVVAESVGTLTLILSDTGAGIGPEGLKKIFDPFYTTKDKGTGLGLSIVYSIIEKHGGSIRVESAEGTGTSFHITLPKGR